MPAASNIFENRTSPVHPHTARPPGPDSHRCNAAGAWQGVPELQPALCPWSQLRPRASREHHLGDPVHRQRVQCRLRAPWLQCHQDP